MQFEDLQLNKALLAAVAAEGYSTPTAIQQKAIPHVMTGRDLIGLAQTGTGKTAAFALPILHQLAQRPLSDARSLRVLVLAPTRELASQIGQSFETYGRGLRFRHTVIFGGVGQGKQSQALREGVDILVATPGRLLDLANQGLVDFKRLEIFVLDEADRMLDMGFIHDVKKVVQKLPTKRQTLFFSATMPDDVQKLADSMLKDPVQVAVHPVSSTAERIEQAVFFVERSDKRALLNHVLADTKIERALVFTRTKHGANRVAEFLDRAKIPAAAIHGNKSQGARERALAQFTSGEIRVLVATDIAARGIDIDGISHVINFDLPNQPESYVHRIGRTGRAGASGTALSFCDIEEREYLVDIERTIGRAVPRAETNPFASGKPAPAAEAPRPAQSRPNSPPRSPREARQQSKGQQRRGPQPPRDGQHSQPPRREGEAPRRQSERVGAAPSGRSEAPRHGQGRPQGQGQARPQGQGRPQGRPQGSGGGHPPRREQHASRPR